MIIGKKKISTIANLVFFISVLFGLAIIINSVGVMLDFWQPIDSFRFSRNVSYPGGITIAIASILTIIYLLRKKNLTGYRKMFFSLIVAIMVLSPAIYSKIVPKGYIPSIHDISTDTVNPPEFIALVGNRNDAPNSLEYGGPEIAEQQLDAYPDIVPIMSTLSPDEAYVKALDVANDMGWVISGADPAAHRFEGTATTAWFKFIDDMVVVISSAENGSRVDIRSVSRIGRSDMGENTKRIRVFTMLFNK